MIAEGVQGGSNNAATDEEKEQVLQLSAHEAELIESEHIVDNETHTENFNKTHRYLAHNDSRVQVLGRTR